MADPTRADAVLEALSLERRPAAARFFEDLFLRFQRRVASETLTRPAGDAETFDAEAFFAEWVDEERGLVGDERARAFAWLAEGCGFETASLEGTCRRPWDDGAPPRPHRGVLATIDGRRVLADAGFPLPVLLPLDSPSSAPIPAAIGELSADVGESGRIAVTCDGRGEVTELLRLSPAPDASARPFEGISEASPADARDPGARDSFALRVLDDRVLFWRAGRMTILDAWSRLDYPLPSSERAALEKTLALDLDGVSLEDPHGETAGPATLTVFHLSPVAPDEARGRVGRDAAPLRLVSGRQEVVEPAAGGSLITIRTTLAAVPPEGPGEAVRKTLVFHLVSEIFALAKGGDERR